MICIDVNSEQEFNQTIQQYMMQGFKVESNINGTCVLKKKGYNTALLIILLILGILFGLIYYLLSNDETVMIRMANSNNQSSEPNFEIDSYCANCGAPLPKNVQFCTNCGFKIDADGEQLQDESSDSEEVDAIVKINTEEN